MLDPIDLLSVAKRLADPKAMIAPSDAQLRRAVSTAYYALFHSVLTAAAKRFMGPAHAARPGYALLYRAFEHGRMKRLCDEVDKPVLTGPLQRQLGCVAIDPDLRAFATAFVRLQRLRHQADYDPHLNLFHVDAIDAVSVAENAMDALVRAPIDERTDFLALLMANTRA